MLRLLMFEVRSANVYEVDTWTIQCITLSIYTVQQAARSELKPPALLLLQFRPCLRLFPPAMQCTLGIPTISHLLGSKRITPGEILMLRQHLPTRRSSSPRLPGAPPRLVLSIVGPRTPGAVMFPGAGEVVETPLHAWLEVVAKGAQGALQGVFPVALVAEPGDELVDL